MTEAVSYVDYTDESMLPDIQRLVSRDLSEPYSVYTYRYFLHNCPRFCICAYAPDPVEPSKQAMIATIVCKLEGEGDAMQGYMAMLAVDKAYRKQGIGKKLVTMVIDRMVEDGCKEVMLETEVHAHASPFGDYIVYDENRSLVSSTDFTHSLSRLRTSALCHCTRRWAS